MTSEGPPLLSNSGSIPPIDLAGDMLRGAAEIAKFLYGDPKQRRTVYHLNATTRFPCFKIGCQLHARKSVLMQWIIDQERRGLSLAELDPKRKLPR